MAADLPVPSKCRYCPELIAWVSTRLGKKVALEPEPQPQGAWVVHQDPALGPTAYHYSPTAHAGQTRYRAHVERCKPRDGKGPVPAQRADPTAGLAFPKRKPQPNDRKVMPRFPPLDELMGVRRG